MAQTSIISLSKILKIFVFAMAFGSATTSKAQSDIAHAIDTAPGESSSCAVNLGSKRFLFNALNDLGVPPAFIRGDQLPLEIQSPTAKYFIEMGIEPDGLPEIAGHKLFFPRGFAGPLQPFLKKLFIADPTLHPGLKGKDNSLFPRNHFQTDALRSLLAAYHRKSSGWLQFPAPLGSSQLMAQFILQSQAHRVLILHPHQEALEQLNDELLRYFQSNDIYWWTSQSSTEGHRVRAARIFLAKPVTYLNSDFESLFPAKDPDVILFPDLRYTTGNATNILNEYYNGRFRVGFAVTPMSYGREGVGVADLLDHPIYEATLLDGMAQGELVPATYRILRAKSLLEEHSGQEMSVDKVDLTKLNRDYFSPVRDRAVVKAFEEYLSGRPTIVYCRSREHANRISAEFDHAGISARAYHSGLSLGERSQILREFKNQKVSVLAVVQLFNQSLDLNFVEGVLFLGQVTSPALIAAKISTALGLYSRA